METEVAKTPEAALKEAVVGKAAPEEAPPKHEPPPEHPRFKEVYGKMKDLERKLSAKDQEYQETLKGIQEHNRMLAESVGKIQDGIEDQNRPDPTIDPEGYEKHVIKKIERKIATVKQETKKEPAKAVPDDVARIAEQADALAEVFDDYEDVVREVMPKIQADQELASKIFSTKNPPAALYKYGMELKRQSQERAAALDQGYVEGGTMPKAADDVQLTPLQERVMMGLGLTKEKYIAQLKMGVR